MAIPKKLTIVFTSFYLATFLYVILFLTIPAVQVAIIEARRNIAIITTGSNYFLAIIISFFISLIGNASVGFPVPYPFILFSFSNAIYINYLNQGLLPPEVLLNGFFWLQIVVIALFGGLGSALGEFVSFFIGRGAKKISKSETLKNVQGFGRLVLEHPKSMYLYVFIAAALPIPDDPLWIALGMTERKINFPKCVIWAWAGKNLTTMFYVLIPIIFGIYTSDDISSVITEAMMLLITITLMFFIMAFDWNKLIEKRRERKNKQKSQ